MKARQITFLFVLMTFYALATDNKYGEIMEKNIDLVYHAKTSEELQQAVNVFDRIGNAEKSRWEPYYYESFGYIMLANNEPDATKKDAFLDQSQAALDKASTLKPNDSEIVALDGFINMIRVTVDPASRGQKYSGMAMQAFQKANTLNPENPRALALMARMQLGLAQFFKAEPTEACATAKVALEKFSTFTSDGALAPQWGKGVAEEVLKNCK